MGRGEKIGLVLQGHLVYQSPTFLVVPKGTRTAGLAPWHRLQLVAVREQGGLRRDREGFLAPLSGVPRAAGARRTHGAAAGAMEKSREDAAAERRCCRAVSRESILWVAQERRDSGTSDISAVLGHPGGIWAGRSCRGSAGWRVTAPRSSDPRVRDLRKETRLLLMILL